MSIDQTCEHIVRQVCSSNLDFHMNQTPYSIYFSIRKKFIKGFSPHDNSTSSTRQNSETEPLEKIHRSEIERLKLELEKKTKVLGDFKKLELFKNELETENKKLRKELSDQKNKYELKCTEIKTIEALRKESKKEQKDMAKNHEKEMRALETKLNELIKFKTKKLDDEKDLNMKKNKASKKISEKENKTEQTSDNSDSEVFDFNFNIPTSNPFGPLASCSSSSSIVASPTFKSSSSSLDVSSPSTTSEPVSLSTDSITFNQKQKQQEEILAALKINNDKLDKCLDVIT